MPAPNTAAEIGREVVDRMVAHCRHVATKYANAQWKSSDLDEVRAIVALLPEPVDPDLAEVREDLALFYENENGSNQWPAVTYRAEMIADVRAGKLDDTPPVRFGLIALKRGRELALKARAVGEGEK